MTQPLVPVFGYAWSESIARQLLDGRTCPACGVGGLVEGWCPACLADLRGPAGEEISRASAQAAAALRARQVLTARVPRTAPSAPAASSPAPVSPPLPSGSARPIVSQAPQSSATLQSVLAIAGAGLFAVAAIVFTFFNPDLADHALRSIIVGLVTLVFVGGAWWLAGRALRSTAEAVGGLGLLFVALDVWAFAQLAPAGTSGWWLVAAGTAVAACAFAIAGRRSGLRVWQAGAVVALSTIPAMLGIATSTALGAALGWVGAAYAAALITRALPMLRHPGVRAGHAEAVALEVLQLVSAIISVLLAGWLVATTNVGGMLSASGVLLLVAGHSLLASRQRLRALWSFGAGASLVLGTAVAVTGLSLQFFPGSVWSAAFFLFAAVVPLNLIARVLPVPSTVHRAPMVVGGLAVLAVASTPFAGIASLTTLGRFGDSGIGANDIRYSWVVLVGLLVVSLGLVALSRQTRRVTELRMLRVFTAVIASLFGVLALLFFGSVPLVVLPVRIAVLVSVAAALASAVRRRYPPLVGPRGVLLVGAHLALVVSAIASGNDPRVSTLAGIGVLVGLAVVASAVPSSLRFWHVGFGYAYALVVLAQALARIGIDGVQLLSLVTSAALLGAIVATFVRRIGPRAWYAVLMVTFVPFALGIAQVALERSAWTALSTALMFALALSVLSTRRPGLNWRLRVAAASLLVPTLAVVVVCLGAELLSVSASPITLPIIAGIVAAALSSTRLIKLSLRRRGLAASTAEGALRAIEWSSVVTAAIAVLLAFVREAAGLGTTALVLLVLGAGAALHARATRRGLSWWAAGACFTGALWSLCALLGVGVLEAYLLPPAIGVALISLFMAARGRQTATMYTYALGAGILPLMVKFAESAPREWNGYPSQINELLLGPGAAWRGAELMGLAVLLLVLGAALGRFPSDHHTTGPQVGALAQLRVPSFAMAMLAAVAGPVQGIRWSVEVEPLSLHGPALFFACLGAAGAGALVMALAAEGIWRVQPGLGGWLWAPAALALAAGTWSAIERDCSTIWLMWSLMIVYLVAIVARAARPSIRKLPPVWFLFVLGLVTAVIAWSPRELRVEWFSLPLGLFLLAAGSIVLWRERRIVEGVAIETPRTLASWPHGWSGSWALIAPGIVVTLFASILATFTDPQTWRAILVMFLALAAILIGATLRLAAPFIVGLVVLPIENVIAFSVQIGRGIESMPWWITLAVVGAVLLIIAVTYERLAGEADSFTARIRDLR